jgi:hypothetical protein
MEFLLTFLHHQVTVKTCCRVQGRIRESPAGGCNSGSIFAFYSLRRKKKVLDDLQNLPMVHLSRRDSVEPLNFGVLLSRFIGDASKHR